MLSNKHDKVNPLTTLREFADVSKCTELLMTSVPPPSTSVQITHIAGGMQGPLPLRTKAITWPTSTAALCLHCSGTCNRGPPLPAVKYFDPQAHQYWVYGPFCTASCAFAHVSASDTVNASKQMSATHKVLRDYFGISDVVVGPPRAAHVRFGGPLGDDAFYCGGPVGPYGGPSGGHSGSGAASPAGPSIKYDVLEPPFVTFAHYVMAVHQATAGAAVANAYDLLPQSAGRLVDLTRPAERTVPLAQKTPTGHPPLLLQYLAELAKEAPASGGGKGASKGALGALGTLGGTAATEPAAKRKRPEEDTIRASSSGGAEKNFLARYIK